MPLLIVVSNILPKVPLFNTNTKAYAVLVHFHELFIMEPLLICPSLVQHECIPQAVTGTDVVCQAKSGMGKTAVFVLAVLNQIDPVDGQVSTLVLCHTRELAYQICREFDRFKKYMPSVKTAVFYGGIPVQQNRDLLKDDCPHIVIGTPGRVLQLVNEGTLKLDNIKHFVLDECDQMLESLGTFSILNYLPLIELFRYEIRCSKNLQSNSHTTSK